MKPKDRFLVGVHLFGVWMLLDCVSRATAGAEAHFKLYKMVNDESAYWFHAGVDLFVGLGLLVYGPNFANFLLWDETPANHCEKCGYDLRGTPDKCPECGTVPTPNV